MIRKTVRMGCWMLAGMVVVCLCMLCTMLTFLLLAVTQHHPTQVDSIQGIAQLLYRDDVEQLRQTQGLHGEVAGYEGYDYTTECGDTLYSPLPGTGIVKYNGYDGYTDGKISREQNTMITIEGAAGTITLLHGDYSKVKPGDTVVGGITPIGKNASIGNSTGCHSHIVWHPNQGYYLVEGSKSITHTGKQGQYGSVLSDYNGVKLVASNYKPWEGDINCDHDCTTMASGDKVADWVLGQNGIRAAACPQEWAFGTRFWIEGQTYECRDRGGYINCYKKGDYDPAYSSMKDIVYYADEKYCWVDLLGDSGISYGTRISTWSFN